MEGVSGVVRGLGDTKEVCYSGKDFTKQDPSLDDAGCPFDKIFSFWIVFYLVLFSPILGHNTALSLIIKVV